MADEKKDWKKILAESRRLENMPLPSQTELDRIKKDGNAEAVKLKKLLASEWFVKDVDLAKKKSKKKK